MFSIIQVDQRTGPAFFRGSYWQILYYLSWIRKSINKDVLWQRRLICLPNLCLLTVPQSNAWYLLLKNSGSAQWLICNVENRRLILDKQSFLTASGVIKQLLKQRHFILRTIFFPGWIFKAFIFTCLVFLLK